MIQPNNKYQSLVKTAAGMIMDYCKEPKDIPNNITIFITKFTDDVRSKC